MKFEDMINTIQLGDCYKLIKQIPDNSIDCIYVDIPYSMSFVGGGALSHKLKNISKMKLKISVME